MNKRIAIEAGKLVVELGDERVTFAAGANAVKRMPHLAKTYMDADELRGFDLLLTEFSCAEVIIRDVSHAGRDLQTDEEVFGVQGSEAEE